MRACVRGKANACKCDVMTSYGVPTIRGLFGRSRLFYRSLLQKRPIIVRSLLVGLQLEVSLAEIVSFIGLFCKRDL